MENNLIEYNGYNIDPVTFEMFNDNKPVFTAWWQRCVSVEDAKRMIDYSNNKVSSVEIIKKIDRLCNGDRTDEAREEKENREESRMETFYSIEHNKL